MLNSPNHTPLLYLGKTCYFCEPVLILFIFVFWTFICSFFLCMFYFLFYFIIYIFCHCSSNIIVLFYYFYLYFVENLFFFWNHYWAYNVVTHSVVCLLCLHSFLLLIRFDVFVFFILTASDICLSRAVLYEPVTLVV